MAACQSANVSDVSEPLGCVSDDNNCEDFSYEQLATSNADTNSYTHIVVDSHIHHTATSIMHTGVYLKPRVHDREDSSREQIVSASSGLHYLVRADGAHNMPELVPAGTYGVNAGFDSSSLFDGTNNAEAHSDTVATYDNNKSTGYDNNINSIGAASNNTSRQFQQQFDSTSCSRRQQSPNNYAVYNDLDNTVTVYNDIDNNEDIRSPSRTSHSSTNCRHILSILYNGRIDTGGGSVLFSYWVI